MRARKQSDSPSGATRDVYQLRSSRHDDGLEEYAMRVKARARHLLADNPHLVGEGARGFFSRMIAPETAPGYESGLNRAAWGLLMVAALDRAEQADPFTGGEAA